MHGQLSAVLTHDSMLTYLHMDHNNKSNLAGLFNNIAKVGLKVVWFGWNLSGIKIMKNV